MFVIVLFLSLSNKYGIFDIVPLENEAGILYTNKDYGDLTYYIVVLAACVVILVIREIWQMFKMKWRYDIKK